jgi:hypothetical protein
VAIFAGLQAAGDKFRAKNMGHAVPFFQTGSLKWPRCLPVFGPGFVTGGLETGKNGLAVYVFLA